MPSYPPGRRISEIFPSCDHCRTHVSLDVAEPNITGIEPERPFHELEAISQFFQLRGRRHKGIECGIEADQIVMNRRLFGLGDCLLGLFSAADEQKTAAITGSDAILYIRPWSLSSSRSSTKLVIRRYQITVARLLAIATFKILD